MGRDSLTQRYLDRAVDGRMVAVIQRHLEPCDSVLDVACGSGLYGPYLRTKARTVLGIDHDPVLCAHARGLGAYDRVVCDRVERLPRHVTAVDAVFCSEFLEHVANAELPGILDLLERTARRLIVITVPNPLSLHYRMDETHVLRYGVYSLLATLRTGSRFSWRLHPLGFADAYRRRLWARPLAILAERAPILSPTVLYVGRRAGQR